MKFLDFVFYISYFFAMFYSVYLLISFLEYYFFNKNNENKDNKKIFSATIVIPAYNEEKNIRKTVESAINLNYPKNKFKIVIVNDGSTDNTLKIAREYEKKYSNVKVINQKNIGKGASLNKVLKQTNTDLFIVFDSDSRIEKNALKNIIKYFDENTAAISPFMIVEKPKNLLQKVQYLEYLIYSFIRKIHSISEIVSVIPGPFSVYKTKILKKLNGFDEKSIVEDQEIAWRLQKEGYKILQDVNAKVYTETPDTLKKLINQRKRWYKGALHTIVKHKDVLFKSKYGNFGLIQAPTVAFGSFIMPIIGIILLFNLLIIPFYKKIEYFFYSGFYYNFDYTKYLFDIKTFWLNTDFTRIILAFFLIVISAYWIFNSFFYADRKFNKTDIIPLIIYMFFYYIILVYTWIISIIEFLTEIVKKEKKYVWYK